MLFFQNKKPMCGFIQLVFFQGWWIFFIKTLNMFYMHVLSLKVKIMFLS